MSFFDEVVKATKEVYPDFDENNSEQLDIMTKSFVLSQLDSKDGERIYQDYLVNLIEKREREHIKKILEQKKFSRQQLIEATLRMAQLEKDIAEHRLKVVREFMD